MSLHPPAPPRQTDAAAQTAPAKRSKVNVKKAVGGSEGAPPPHPPHPLGRVWLLVFLLSGR